MAEFVIVPVLIMGVLLAILEIIFVHQDEAGMHPLAHALHAIPVMFVFIFISMNIEWVTTLIKVPWLNTVWGIITIRFIIGVIAAIKISAAAAVAGKVGEKLPHTLTIAALIMAAPFIWELFVCAMPFAKNIPMNGCPAIR